MTYHNAHTGTSMTIRNSGKSFVVVLFHEATKHSQSEQKTKRVKTWAGIERLIKKWNLTQV